MPGETVFSPITVMLEATPRIDMPGGPAAWDKAAAKHK